ncbi:MAG TPA: hypothetical protein VIM73_17615, partial [Polyangiaceae bacterium]
RGRLDDYVLASAMLRERPLLGWGPRRWEEASSAIAHTLESRHASAYVFWVTPNSDLARIAGEQGLAGVVTLVAFVAALGQAWLRCWRRQDPIAIPVLLGFVVYGLNALWDAPLFRQSSLAVIAGLCALMRGGSPRLMSLPARAVGRAASTVAFALVLLTGARVSAAAVIRLGEESIDARREAQRLWPRPGVAQSIAVSLAQKGRCEQAGSAAEKALAWTPHHWAPAHFAGLCWLRRGEIERALTLRERALSIEPHLDALIRHKRQGSGNLRLDEEPQAPTASHVMQMGPGTE